MSDDENSDERAQFEECRTLVEIAERFRSALALFRLGGRQTIVSFLDDADRVSPAGSGETAAQVRATAPYMSVSLEVHPEMLTSRFDDAEVDEIMIHEALHCLTGSAGLDAAALTLANTSSGSGREAIYRGWYQWANESAIDHVAGIIWSLMKAAGVSLDVGEHEIEIPLVVVDEEEE